MAWMQEEKVAFQLQSSVLMAGEFMRIYFSPCSLSIRLRKKMPLENKAQLNKNKSRLVQRVEVGLGQRCCLETSWKGYLVKYPLPLTCQHHLPASPASITCQPSPASNSEDASPHHEWGQVQGQASLHCFFSSPPVKQGCNPDTLILPLVPTPSRTCEPPSPCLSLTLIADAP